MHGVDRRWNDLVEIELEEVLERVAQRDGQVDGGKRDVALHSGRGGGRELDQHTSGLLGNIQSPALAWHR